MKKGGGIPSPPPWTEGVVWVKDTSRTQTTFTDFGGSPWLFGPLSKKKPGGLVLLEHRSHAMHLA